MKKWIAVFAVLGMAFSTGATARGYGGHYGGGHYGGHYYGHSHTSVGFYFGGPYWGGYGPGYWGGYPPSYYDYGYGYPYPAYSQAPVNYVQQPAAAQPPAGNGDWYYCSRQDKYYPYVKTCPSGWSRIPAVPDGANR